MGSDYFFEFLMVFSLFAKPVLYTFVTFLVTNRDVKLLKSLFLFVPIIILENVSKGLTSKYIEHIVPSHYDTVFIVFQLTVTTLLASFYIAILMQHKNGTYVDLKEATKISFFTNIAYEGLLAMGLNEIELFA